jgi:hypothetical protein
LIPKECIFDNVPGPISKSNFVLFISIKIDEYDLKLNDLSFGIIVPEPRKIIFIILDIYL